MAAIEMSERRDPPAAERRTVLIVEDNELNMKLFHDLLDAHGYRVIEARNGPEAMERVRAGAPDLILMDIQLPEVSGLEVTRRINEELGELAPPIVAVTAFAMKGDEERIRAGGCRDYIAKPISVVDFLEKVKTHLN